MNKIQLLLLILLSILFFVRCEEEVDANHDLLVHGIVVDKYSGEPIQGARVTLRTDYTSFKHSQVTGVDGRYSMSVEMPMYYSYLNVYAYGYDELLYQEIGGDSDSFNISDEVLKKDFKLTEVLLNFPFSARFEDPNYFVLTNKTNRIFNEVDLNSSLISIGSKESKRVNFLTKNQSWEVGDKVTIKVSGMNKTWTYR